MKDIQQNKQMKIKGDQQLLRTTIRKRINVPELKSSINIKIPQLQLYLNQFNEKPKNNQFLSTKNTTSTFFPKTIYNP